jgi:hypothetical protein
MRYLLVAFLALLLPAFVAAQAEPAPYTNVHLEPTPYGHALTWEVTGEASAWYVLRDNLQVWASPIGLRPGDTPFIPLAGGWATRPGSATYLCAAQAGAVWCARLWARTVALPLLHH